MLPRVHLRSSHFPRGTAISLPSHRLVSTVLFQPRPSLHSYQKNSPAMACGGGCGGPTTDRPQSTTSNTNSAVTAPLEEGSTSTELDNSAIGMARYTSKGNDQKKQTSIYATTSTNNPRENYGYFPPTPEPAPHRREALAEDCCLSGARDSVSVSGHGGFGTSDGLNSMATKGTGCCDAEKPAQVPSEAWCAASKGGKDVGDSCCSSKKQTRSEKQAIIDDRPKCCQGKSSPCCDETCLDRIALRECQRFPLGQGELHCSGLMLTDV